jgi:hypothetical protein
LNENDNIKRNNTEKEMNLLTKENMKLTRVARQCKHSEDGTKIDEKHGFRFTYSFRIRTLAFLLTKARGGQSKKKREAHDFSSAVTELRSLRKHFPLIKE